MANRSEKKSAVVTVGDEGAATAGFTERVLLSLVLDLEMLREQEHRVRVQVHALAKAHGIDTSQE